MSNVSFEEEQQMGGYVPAPRKKGMADWLVAKGIAKDMSQANVYLLLIAALAFGTSLYFFFFK